MVQREGAFAERYGTVGLGEPPGAAALGNTLAELILVRNGQILSLQELHSSAIRLSLYCLSKSSYKNQYASILFNMSALI